MCGECWYVSCVVSVGMSCVWCLIRFVAKVRALDPSYRDVMPWQPRAYSRKREREGGRGGGQVHEPQAKKLFSPLLAGEKVGPQQVSCRYMPYILTGLSCGRKVGMRLLIHI